MHEEWMRTICQIGIFMLCARTISHFRPREAYEKYFKLLLGIMVLVQVFLPFGRLFFGMDAALLQEGVAQFERKLEQSMEAAAKQALVVEKKMEQMSMLEVQQRLEEQQLSEGQTEEPQSQAQMQTAKQQGVVEPVEIEVTIGQ